MKLFLEKVPNHNWHLSGRHDYVSDFDTKLGDFSGQVWLQFCCCALPLLKSMIKLMNEFQIGLCCAIWESLGDQLVIILMRTDLN
jgi:hypothetical protein